MQTLAEARELADLMVSVAKRANRKAVALLSDMNQPLGCAVGNALEVKEAIDTLHGGGPQDFCEHCLTVATHMLLLGGKAPDETRARKLAENALQEGRAWEKFRALVITQGGDVTFVDDSTRLPTAQFIKNVPAPRGGFLSRVDARRVGEAAVALGGGRAKKGDAIDHSVGVIVHHKVGDRVEPGQPLFTVHANDEEKMAWTCQQVLEAHAWNNSFVEPLPLFYGVIR
jgi:pyrimidine-nucleoside phosphorylase